MASISSTTTGEAAKIRVLCRLRTLEYRQICISVCRNDLLWGVEFLLTSQSILDFEVSELDR